MNLRDTVRAVLREPLVHFLCAGAAIFLFFLIKGVPADPASRVIRVDEARVAGLVAGWQQTWQRMPTKAETDALIRDYIKEEIYYREARRLGLDEDDPGIRRRLRLKMEYLVGAEVENFQPSDATLQAWLDRNPARYADDARYSFDQIYLAADDPAEAAARAPRILAALKGGADWRTIGDRISLPPTLERTERNDVARQFGDGFAAALAARTPGDWTGPIKSGFGLHLVRLRAAMVPAPPRLAEVRQQVENDWRAETLASREARAYQILLDGYRIEWKP